MTTEWSKEVDGKTTIHLIQVARANGKEVSLHITEVNPESQRRFVCTTSPFRSKRMEGALINKDGLKRFIDVKKETSLSKKYIILEKVESGPKDKVTSRSLVRRTRIDLFYLFYHAFTRISM